MARANPKCPQCGSSNLEPGTLLPVGFMPKKRKLLTWAGGGVPVSGSACTDCGYLQLSVDTGKLTKIVGYKAPDRRRGFPVTPRQCKESSDA